MLRTCRNPCLLKPCIAVLIAASLDCRQSSHAPLEAIRAGSFAHFAHDPCTVGHEQSLVIQHQLLILGKVLIVRLCRSDGVGVGGQFGHDVKAGLCFGSVPDAFFIMGRLVEEVGAACCIHQRIKERIKVAGGGVSEQVGALRSRLVTQFPHFIPCGGHIPAFFFQEPCVVEQTAGAVEHGSQIGLAIAVRVGKRSIGKAAGDLLADFLALTGNRHAQHIGDVSDQIALDELLGQSSFTTGSQMDYIRVIAALHGGADDIFQVLVGGQFNLDARLGGKGFGDFLPHLGAVSGLNGSDFDGHILRRRGRGSSRRSRAGTGRAGRTAAGGQPQCSGTHASRFQEIATRNAFHSVSSIIKIPFKTTTGTNRFCPRGSCDLLISI